MRLCGISSRFQLLSPSTRQVTHALLTRPPLTYISLGFNVSPFDLHVLGTPPAFILSQDQTLMLKWCLCPASFIWHCLLLIRVACQSFDQLACSWISLKILEFSGLHYCLFVKDHNLLLRKSLFVCCCCSQRQLWYLIITAFVCQQLFEIFFCLGKLCFPWQIFMLTYLSDFVNNFFEIFSSFFRAVVLSRHCLNNESEYIIR